MADINPVGVNLDEFISSMTTSLINASEQVYATSYASGHGYVVPEMEVKVSMSFTFEGGKVKGILGRTKETTSQQLDSSVSFKIVAIPGQNRSGVTFQPTPNQPLPPSSSP